MHQVELKTSENGLKDNKVFTQSTTTPIPNETCCDRVLSYIISIFACSNSYSSFINCLSNSLTHSYDLLAILISIADVTTDVWVIYKFYIDKRETFFIISLIVMIAAQLSYDVAFLLRFQPKWSSWHRNTEIRTFAMFCTILPLSPIMSFIFFWCEINDKNWFIKLLDKMFDIDGTLAIDIHKHDPEIILWIKRKARKHMGFVLEAMLEALPQSIIQLIAIVYYQDTQIINVISICISLLSVATKTMVCHDHVLF